MIRLYHLRATVFVALKTGFQFCALSQLVFHRHFFHQLMAIGAGQPTRFVCRTVPIGAVRFFMTVQANRVAALDCPRRFFAEANDVGCPAIITFFALDMLGCGTVTAFTTQFFRSIARLLQKHFTMQRFGKSTELALVAA